MTAPDVHSEWDKKTAAEDSTKDPMVKAFQDRNLEEDITTQQTAYSGYEDRVGDTKNNIALEEMQRSGSGAKRIGQVTGMLAQGAAGISMLTPESKQAMAPLTQVASAVKAVLDLGKEGMIERNINELKALHNQNALTSLARKMNSATSAIEQLEGSKGAVGDTSPSGAAGNDASYDGVGLSKASNGPTNGMA